jgi:hypothetical protein
MPSALVFLEPKPSIGPSSPREAREFVELKRNNKNAKKQRDVRRA